jgi:hypothetical protein
VSGRPGLVDCVSNDMGDDLPDALLVGRSRHRGAGPPSRRAKRLLVDLRDAARVDAPVGLTAVPRDERRQRMPTELLEPDFQPRSFSSSTRTARCSRRWAA